MSLGFDPGHAGPPAQGMHIIWNPLGPVTLDQRGRPRFPEVAEAPGLYRLLIREGERLRVYIGETDNIHRQLQSCLDSEASKDEKDPLVRHLFAALKAAGEVSLAVITECSLLEPTGKAQAADLSEQAVRNAVREAALILIVASDVDLLDD